MSSETLTSLAMLKVSIDMGSDYLDYLRPFVLQVLVDQKPDPVTTTSVYEGLLKQFGLEIPERAVQIVLRRISRRYALQRESGVYRIAGPLPDPGIAARKVEAERHIRAVVRDIISYSQATTKPLTSDDAAVTAICTFLGEFDVQCLRAFLRGTVIPALNGDEETDVVLVSHYLLELLEENPERFDSFMVIAQGNMLANALLCPDLQNAPKTYRGMEFYLDTPLLVRGLGLEGEPRRAAVMALITLLHNLGATVAAFHHSRDELRSVVMGAATHIDERNPRSAIVAEARRAGTTKSDLLLLADQIDDRLDGANVVVRDTPAYTAKFQIDETAFEDVLEDEVSYFNPRAKEYDINSVRSIYVLRANTSPYLLEKSKAVLVTSNAGFARAAYRYGERYRESYNIPSVITDFALANLAWLKAPMGALTLPRTEIIAFAYAALRPSRELLAKYVAEIDRLERQGKITPRDHQLLRSSPIAQEELMFFTLGDEDALTEEAITETLARVSNEIKREEHQKLTAEQTAHRHTRAQLEAKQAETRRIEERMYWRCERRALICSWVVAVLVAVVLVGAITGGVVLQSCCRIPGWALTVCASLALLWAIADALFGVSVMEVRGRLEKLILTRLIRHEASTLGLEIGRVS